MRRTQGWLVCAALATVGVAGCFKADFTNCTVTCATNSDCPGGLACSAQGLCSSGGSECMPMEPDADLTMPQPLTVTTTGDGVVTSDPTGINCGTQCAAEFDPLSTVMLTATPGANAVFDSWTGDCSGATSPCSLTMDNSKTVGANFLTHGARRWFAQISFTGQDYLDGEMDIDANGDVVAAGQIENATTTVLGIYVVKYAKADGAIIWQKNLDTPNAGMYVGGIDTDSDGNVYVCTRFQAGGSLTFDGKTVTGDIFGNIVVMRFAAATGAIDWAKSWGGTSEEECGGIAVSGNEFFITGNTSSDPSGFDAQSITGAGVNSAFIVRAATATGLASQAKVLVGNFIINDIAVNGTAVAVVGGIRGTTPAINTCSLNVTSTGSDALIMNFNGANLNCVWSKTNGSNTANEASFTNAVAPIPGGGWVATGAYTGSVNFGSGSSLPTSGGFDAFLARWDAAGTYVYSFGYGGTSGDIGSAIDVTSTGEVVWGGQFASAITLGSFPLTGTSDVFITRMSSGVTPIHQWAVKYGGTAGENLTGLNLDAQGNPFLLVNWTGMSDIAGMPVTGQGYDAWVGSFVR